MDRVKRVFDEYRGLAQVLDRGDYLSLLKATAISAPEILRTGKLTSVDAAMSRNMTVCFGKSRPAMPLADIDAILKAQNDNPTFGNVREIYARNCYLHGLRLKAPQHTMELHPREGDLSLIPRALEDYGFEYMLQDQSGNPDGIDSAMFLFASSTGVLAN